MGVATLQLVFACATSWTNKYTAIHDAGKVARAAFQPAPPGVVDDGQPTSILYFMANVPHDRPLATREESAAAGVTPCAYRTRPFGFWVGGDVFFIAGKTASIRPKR